MALTAQTYGVVPVFHPTGQIRVSKHTIASGYAASIYSGDPVKVHTDGTLNVGDGTSPALGIFAGCEYIDANGKPTVSPYWPASTTATNIVAYVYDDQQTVFRVGVSANASGFTQAVVGQQVNIDNPGTGSTATGRSAASVANAAIAAGTLAQMRIIGYVDGEVYNATTNPFPQLLVQLSEVQFAPNAVGV